ncbi:hypothetical protein YC2023_056009 [Brassica napus]
MALFNSVADLKPFKTMWRLMVDIVRMRVLGYEIILMRTQWKCSSVMEKLSQRFASPSCHRVIGDIPMGKQCAMTIVGEIKTSPDIVMLILNVVKELKEETAVLHKLKDWLQTLPMARHRLVLLFFSSLSHRTQLSCREASLLS